MSSDITVKLKIRVYTLNDLGYRPHTCTFRIPSKITTLILIINQQQEQS